MDAEKTKDYVTQLLIDWSQGDEQAEAELWPLVYDELRQRARNYLRHERTGHTLETSALVNEAYLRLVNQTRVNWQNRAHFFAVAATIMRRILMNYAEARRAQIRGGNASRVVFDDAMNVLQEQNVDILDLDKALTRLSELDSRAARIVELRFIAGLTNEEIAEVMNLSVNTVMRDWRTAKVWLLRALKKDR